MPGQAPRRDLVSAEPMRQHVIQYIADTKITLEMLHRRARVSGSMMYAMIAGDVPWISINTADRLCEQTNTHVSILYPLDEEEAA